MTKLLYNIFKTKYMTLIMLIAVSVGYNVSSAYTVTLKLPNIKHKLYVEPELATIDEYEWKVKNKQAETMCLAKNIYFEGRGESTIGQLAIGLVTLNRVKNKRFPQSICKVVWQKGRNRRDKLVAQFSWTLDGNSNTPKTRTSLWNRIYRLAEAMTAGGSLSNFKDITGGALFYHAKYMDPKWYNLRFIKDIEHHRFYTA